MGIINNLMVMLSGPSALLLLLATLSAASVCPQGKQFLSQQLQICVNCTICDSEKGDVVLRPCEVHRDTLCGPLSELKFNWDFLQPKHENHHRHQHHKHHHHEQDKIIWHFGDKTTEKHFQPEPRTYPSEVITEAQLEVTSAEVQFSSAETFIWDWQAVSLTLGVFACILFFLVIALYSLHQAKQWRRLKENFDADVEELSARLSLMAASSIEKGEMLESNMSPIHEGNYLNNKCVYLEQLLNVRKDTKIGSETGNVYIEESNPGPNGKT